MPAMPSDPVSPPPLPTLDEQVLLRAWIRGVPLAALATPVDPDTFARLAELRLRLFLKATRLQEQDAEVWLKRRTDTAWERTALRSLERLLHPDDLQPSPDQPLRFWLAPDWVAALSASGLQTLADLSAFRQRHGKPWWQGIPGLGRVSAKRIEQTLDSLCPGVTTPVKHPALPTYSTDLVPLDRFLLPEAFDGSHGRNRATADPFIPLSNDLAALHAWLSLRDPGSHTFRSYQREAERLLLWTILIRQKAFADLDAVDLAAYRGFLKDPQPAGTWIGPPQTKTHPQWKPFTGPLALRSIKHTETILGGLFTFLVEQRYLAHNPLSALPRLTTPADHIVLGVHRAFSPEQWALISTSAQENVHSSTGQGRRKAIRTRFILQLTYATGLRLHELTQALISDIITLVRPSPSRKQQAGSDAAEAGTQYWLRVVGKGQKLRQVPLPPSTLQQLKADYQSLTGQSLNRQHPDYPLIPSLHNTRLAVTPLAIHKILKAFFSHVAERVATDHPDAVQPLLQASTHWLRHTHGSVAVEQGIPLTMIRDNLGHASIATTSHYLHAEADARYEAFKHLPETAEHTSD